MKLLLYAGGLLLLCSCSVPSQSKMTWKDYHVSRHALHVVYSRADVIDCEELGSVSGQSYDDVNSAEEKAISAAVLLQADHILFDEVATDIDARSAYLPGGGNIIRVYGMAYRCGECAKCIKKPE